MQDLIDSHRTVGLDDERDSCNSLDGVFKSLDRIPNAIAPTCRNVLRSPLLNAGILSAVMRIAPFGSSAMKETNESSNCCRDRSFRLAM